MIYKTNSKYLHLLLHQDNNVSRVIVQHISTVWLRLEKKTLEKVSLIEIYLVEFFQHERKNDTKYKQYSIKIYQFITRHSTDPWDQQFESMFFLEYLCFLCVLIEGISNDVISFVRLLVQLIKQIKNENK